MYDYIANPTFQSLLLRVFLSSLIFWVFAELYLSIKHVESKRLATMFWKVARFILGFFLTGVLAAIIDWYYDFQTKWFAFLTNFIFWTVLVLRSRRTRILLSHGKDTPQRSELRESIDDLLSQMEATRLSLKKVRQKI